MTYQYKSYKKIYFFLSLVSVWIISLIILLYSSNKLALIIDSIVGLILVISLSLTISISKLSICTKNKVINCKIQRTLKLKNSNIDDNIQNTNLKKIIHYEIKTLTSFEKKQCPGSIQIGNKYLILISNEFKDIYINISGFNKKQIESIEETLNQIII